jgi:hypothetical protein
VVVGVWVVEDLLLGFLDRFEYVWLAFVGTVGTDSEVDLLGVLGLVLDSCKLGRFFRFFLISRHKILRGNLAESDWIMGPAHGHRILWLVG